MVESDEDFESNSVRFGALVHLSWVPAPVVSFLRFVSSCTGGRIYLGFELQSCKSIPLLLLLCLVFDLSNGVILHCEIILKSYLDLIFLCGLKLKWMARYFLAR